MAERKTIGSPFHGNGIARAMYETMQKVSADYINAEHRQLSNTAAEEAVVAAILLDDCEVVAEGVTSVLTPEMFLDDPCRAAYRAWLWLREREMQPTILTIAFAWSELGWIDDIDRVTEGAEPWLANTVGQHLTAIGVEAHARIVRDLYERRTQLTTAREMAVDALQPKGAGVGRKPIYERAEYQVADV